MSTGQECLEIVDDTSSVMASERPRFKRSRNGCLCCRIRKKKCDGNRPICAGCQRNDLICSWPEPHRDGTVSATISSQRINDHTKSSSLVRVNSEVAAIPAPTLMSMVASQGQPIFLAEPVPWPMKNVQLRNPSSFMLFQHFYENTIPIFAPTSFSNNPFFRYVLPYADTDSKVVHILLALSGSFVRATTNNQSLYVQSLQHYAIGLREIKTTLRRCQAGESADILRLFLSSLLLCYREGIDTCNNGSTLFVHLRAARECATWFTKNSPSLSHAEHQLLGFLMEYYTYCVLMNQVTFDTDSPIACLLDDDFVLSFKYLQTFSSCGVLFGCAYQFYEIIPRICQLAKARKSATDRFVDGAGDSTLMEFARLQNIINAWNPPATEYVHGIKLQVQLDAARVVQLSMSIFLHAAFHNDDPSNVELKTKIEPLIAEGLPLLLKVACSPMCTSILWSATVMSSCLSDPLHQTMCLHEETMDNALYAMAHVEEIFKTVTCIWNDPDESVFGPAGIAHVAKKQGTVLNVI